mmetsp:Transcript_102063/g.293894  ORF Transcript_102063/g.293894 Transcript_102063/m.293894 type:complete len:359 (+) Transcript_102063:1040-2116(+)
MPGQADNPRVVREVLAAELRANLQVLGALEHLRLPLEVAESSPMLVPRGRQVVVVPGACQLHGLQAGLRGGAADDQGHMVWRAGGRSQRLQLLLDEGFQLLRVQQRLSLLEEVCLVRGAAALGHEHEGVLVALRSHKVDLRGQIRLRVPLGEHGHGRHLRVAQVPAGEGVVDAAGEVPFIVAVGEHILAALAHDNGGACVLAAGQHALRRDRGVLQQIPRGETVIVRGLRVLQDLGQLGEVPRAEVVLDLAHAVVGELREDPWLDARHAALDAADLDGLGRDALAHRLILNVRNVDVHGVLKHGLVHEFGVANQIFDILVWLPTYTLFAPCHCLDDYGAALRKQPSRGKRTMKILKKP